MGHRGLHQRARHIAQGARLLRLFGFDGERLLDQSVKVLVIQ